MRCVPTSRRAGRSTRPRMRSCGGALAAAARDSGLSRLWSGWRFPRLPMAGTLERSDLAVDHLAWPWQSPRRSVDRRHHRAGLAATVVQRRCRDAFLYTAAINAVIRLVDLSDTRGKERHALLDREMALLHAPTHGVLNLVGWVLTSTQVDGRSVPSIRAQSKMPGQSSSIFRRLRSRCSALLIRVTATSSSKMYLVVSTTTRSCPDSTDDVRSCRCQHARPDFSEIPSCRYSSALVAAVGGRVAVDQTRALAGAADRFRKRPTGFPHAAPLARPATTDRPQPLDSGHRLLGGPQLADRSPRASMSCHHCPPEEADLPGSRRSTATAAV